MPEKGEQNGKEGEQEQEGNSGTPGEGSPSPNGQEGLTQEQVNELVGKARVEGRTTGQSSLLKKFGFDSEDAIDEFIKAAREKEDAEKSELEKLQSQLEKANARAEDAETATQQALQQSQVTLMRSAVDAEIMTNEELNINPEARADVWLFLSTTSVGENGIHLDENGKVQGVEKALKDLIKEKPYLASTQKDDTPGSQTRYTRGKVSSTGKDDDTPPTGKNLDYTFPKL